MFSHRAIDQHWERRVAREVEHQARIEVAFDGADACQLLGHCEDGLKWLDRAEALGGGLPPAYRAQRTRSARELARQQGAAAIDPGSG